MLTGAVTGDDKELVFVFRGTGRTDEWFSNIAGAYLVPYRCTDGFELGNAAKVHWGFRNMYSCKLKCKWADAEDKETPRQVTLQTS